MTSVCTFKNCMKTESMQISSAFDEWGAVFSLLVCQPRAAND